MHFHFWIFTEFLVNGGYGISQKILHEEEEKEKTEIIT